MDGFKIFLEWGSIIFYDMNIVLWLEGDKE